MFLQWPELRLEFAVLRATAATSTTSTTAGLHYDRLPGGASVLRLRCSILHHQGELHEDLQPQALAGWRRPFGVCGFRELEYSVDSVGAIVRRGSRCASM
ncbi:MAG: hypothetical protein ACRD3T_16440 [Terriglobia bacterium]